MDINIFDIEEKSFFRIWIGNGNPNIRGRLGGFPPEGVSPKNVYNTTKYLLTLPFGPNNDLSIFHSFDFENDGIYNPFDNWLTLYDDAADLLQFCFHDIRPQGHNIKLESELPCYSLNIDSTIYEDNSFHDEKCYPYHKIGGYPFFNKEFDTNIYEKCINLSPEFKHILQLAFPIGPDDVLVNGNWPFGECVLNIFMNKDMCLKYVWG